LYKETKKKYGAKGYIMSLENIQLPPIVIQDLFRKSLIEQNKKEIGHQAADPLPAEIAYLGKNGRNIAVLVSSPDTLYLPDNELDFLMGILTACKLTMADIALVNMAQMKEVNYKALEKALLAEKIFLFGPGPDELQLPIAFPHYQVQRYNNQVYLAAPTLKQLQADKMEKSKLWTCLKQIFSI
jgi:hypothetical protein